MCVLKTNNESLVFYPEYTESFSNKSNRKCKCGFLLEEKINERIEEELLECSVLLKCDNLGINRVVQCIVRGSLCQAIEIGKKLCFIGYLTNKGTFFDVKCKVEINNVLETDMSTCTVEHLSWMNIWSCIPQDISSFEFGPAFMMAFMFADEVTPAGSFFFLKLLLMLLLLSNTSESHTELDASMLVREELSYRPISLLIASSDTNIVSKIINVAKCYTSDFWIHGSQDLLLGRMVKVENTMTTEFGTLLLPANHVALLPNLRFLTNKYQSQLKKVLLDRFVQPLTKPSGVLYQRPLCCKVWASIDLNVDSPDIAGLPESVRSLAQAFDLICLVQDPDSEYWESVIVSHTLDKSIGRSDVSSDEYHQLYHSFLQNTARVIVTKWSHEAELFVRGYYIVGRKFTKKTRIVFPQSAFSVLLQLATNLAKLNNRSIINPCDALLAIYLFEVLYSSKLGHTLLGLSESQYGQLLHVRSISREFLEEFLDILRVMKTNLVQLIRSHLDPMFFEE